MKKILLIILLIIFNHVTIGQNTNEKISLFYDVKRTDNTIKEYVLDTTTKLGRSEVDFYYYYIYYYNNSFYNDSILAPVQLLGVKIYSDNNLVKEYDSFYINPNKKTYGRSVRSPKPDVKVTVSWDSSKIVY